MAVEGWKQATCSRKEEDVEKVETVPATLSCILCLDSSIFLYDFGMDTITIILSNEKNIMRGFYVHVFH